MFSGSAHKYKNNMTTYRHSCKFTIKIVKQVVQMKNWMNCNSRVVLSIEIKLKLFVSVTVFWTDGSVDDTLNLIGRAFFFLTKKWWMDGVFKEWNIPPLLKCHLTHQLFPSSATKYTVSVTTQPTPFWNGIYLLFFGFVLFFAFSLTLKPFLCFLLCFRAASFPLFLFLNFSLPVSSLAFSTLYLILIYFLSYFFCCLLLAVRLLLYCGSLLAYRENGVKIGRSFGG